MCTISCEGRNVQQTKISKGFDLVFRGGSYYKSYVGTPDQKEGHRLGELSVKYNF
jgi:hypothetical protein